MSGGGGEWGGGEWSETYGRMDVVGCGGYECECVGVLMWVGQGGVSGRITQGRVHCSLGLIVMCGARPVGITTTGRRRREADNCWRVSILQRGHDVDEVVFEYGGGSCQ